MTGEPEKGDGRKARWVKAASGVYFLLAAAYVAYSGYSYTGLYRFLAEAQLRWFHEYEVQLTFVVAFLIVLLPAIVLVPKRYRGPMYRGYAQSQSATSSQSRAEIQRRQGKIALVVGVLFLPLGFAVGEGVRRVWKVEPLTTLDLRAGDQPTSAYVELSGTVLTKMVVHYTEDEYGKKEFAVAPMVSPDWNGNRPIRFFIRTSSNRAFMRTQTAGGKGAPFSSPYATLDRSEPPFFMTYKFVLERDGLPGMVREQYTRGGVQVAEPHYLLEDKQPTDPQTAYYICLTLGAIGGLAGLATGLGMIIGARRLERR